jgi:hypothetical protein
MNPLDWIGGLIKVIPEQVGGYFRERQAQKSAENLRKMEFDDALHKRKLALIEQGLTADMNWEVEFAKQAATSWKDEYTLIVVSIPLVMAFIPGLAAYVKLGFEAFAGTPLWYQVMVQSIFYATYGMRLWRRNQSDT